LKVEIFVAANCDSEPETIIT